MKSKRVKRERAKSKRANSQPWVGGFVDTAFDKVSGNEEKMKSQNISCGVSLEQECGLCVY